MTAFLNVGGRHTQNNAPLSRGRNESWLKFLLPSVLTLTVRPCAVEDVAANKLEVVIPVRFNSTAKCFILLFILTKRRMGGCSVRKMCIGISKLHQPLFFYLPNVSISWP